MPPKLAAEKIAQRLADLRIYVEEHAARINQRSGRSLREKLDQRFSKEEQSWHKFLWNQEDKFTADHRQHLSDIFALVSTGTPTELIGGVNVRADVFVWRIQANQGELYKKDLKGRREKKRKPMARCAMTLVAASKT